jgi:predicted metal-dependent peptidase
MKTVILNEAYMPEDVWVPNPLGVQRFEEGVQAVLLSQPFFASLLMKMNHQAKPCGTAGVNGRDLMYDPEFFAKMDMDEAMFVVCHEVLHCAWDQLHRAQAYHTANVGPDGQEYDHQLFNMAMDYPVNASLVESCIGKVPKLVQCCLDQKRFPSSMTPEEVYCELKKDQKKQGGKLGNGPPGPGEPGGHQVLDQHGEPSTDPQSITAADVQQAANLCEAQRGTLPAGIDRLLGQIKRPPVSPWRRLRQAVVTSLKGYDSTSWRRLHRTLIVRRIGVPGRIAHGSGTIGIVVDTSGSIGEAMLNLFGSHMAAIIDDARPEKVFLYWTDAAMHRRDEVKSSTALRSLLTKPVPGGGGTDMPVGVRCAEEDKCDCVVVLTDGYTPFCGSKKKLVWAITSHNVSAPKGMGETIHIT